MYSYHLLKKKKKSGMWQWYCRNRRGNFFFFFPSYFGNAIAKITFLFRTNFDLSVATLWESHIADSFKLDSEAHEVEGFTVTRSPSGSGGWEVCDCERAMMEPWAMVAHGGTQIAGVRG